MKKVYDLQAENNKIIDSIIKLLIFAMLLLLLTFLEIRFVNAGQTNFNQNPNLKAGDCWNGRTINSIDGFKVIWETGCKKCELIKGGGTINIFTSNLDYGLWVYDEIKTEKPFNEFNYNLYLEKNEGDCSGKYPDFRINLKDIHSLGLANWGDIGNIKINKNLDNPKWHFLLFHELLHLYMKSGHTNDNSILDQDGGDSKIRDYQINIIRESLK